MKKTIAFLTLLLLSVSFVQAAPDPAAETGTERSLDQRQFPPSVATLLEIPRIYSCTLTAELSYQGVSVKMSITADTCEEAGAGLAQATKAFINEIKNKT